MATATAHTRITFAVECYVDGVWQSGDGPEVESIDPTTGEVLAAARSAGPTQVRAAVEGAHRAFDDGEWSRLTARERSDLLFRLADLLERDKEELTRLVASEVGTPVSTGRDLHVDLPVMFFRWFAEAARWGPRDGLEEALPLNPGPPVSSSVLLREPAGVVAAITAYNYPLTLASWKLGGALASGCTAVLVPSPKAVVSTVAFMRLLEEAGFPAGAVNLVFGPPAVTEQVVTADAVSLVSFTGSAAVGSKIMALAAPGLKKVVLELGGKSPNILLPGCDVKSTVRPSVLRFCRNAGQGCGATTRTLVPEADFDEYVEEASRVMSGLAVGDPLAPETEVGPVISDEHRRNVEGYLARAVDEEGAVFATGGGRPAGLDDGFFLEPTLVTGARNEAEINQEELFAPVGAVIPYEDVDEAVRIANESKYGLNANIWGPTPDGIALARRIRSGTVTINGGSGKHRDAPWGGYGASGIGRECGEDGYREFFEVKHIQWPL